jgi:hypothetical protein
MGEAPAVFRVDHEGQLIILKEIIALDDIGKAMQAVSYCSKKSLRLAVVES